MKIYLDSLGGNDLVFTRSKAKEKDRLEMQMMIKILDRLNLHQRYSSNNFHKITTHSFRAFFFTHAARKHGENYAHRLTGHGGYLMQYDRMTEDEKLQMYLELEPELVVFDQTKSELEITRLRDKVNEIDELKKEVQKLRENQAKIDKQRIEEMRNHGTLLS